MKEARQCVLVRRLHISASLATLHSLKCGPTFLGLVLLGFALVIKTHGALVDTIRLHSVSPPKASGVV